MSELTVDFNEPYIGGSGSGVIPSPIPPDQVGIDTRQYLLDTKSGEYRREGIEVLQQRNTNNNRDLLLLPQEVWRQQFESWHQGAGQLNADREDALPYRFSRSFGIDPWTKYELSLLNDTTKAFDLTDTKKCWVQPHGIQLVIVHGTTATFMDPDFSTAAPLSLAASDAIGITYDGDGVFTLHDDGSVFHVTNATTATARTITPPAAPATPNPITEATFIAYVKDYLILGVGNQLWDITATQAKLIYTSPVTGFTWVGAAEGANAIYCVGGVNDKHVVHRIGVKDDGTGLTPGVVAGSLPDGEIGTAIGSYLGYVFIGTNKGVRMATPSGTQGDLTLGALIPTDAPVYGFEGQDRFVWATASSINSTPTGEAEGHDDFPNSPVCGLYRADLSTFTVTESTPAYATDLFAFTQHNKTVRSVATWGGKRVFTVENGGVYVENNHKVKGGWIEMGRVSYSVEDLKTGLYAQGKWEPLDGSVEMYLSYDNDHPTRIMNWGVQGSIRSGNISLDGKQFSRVDPRVELHRSATDTTKGPIFTRYEIRARAVKGDASRWYLPIMNHESLDLNGVIQARDVVVEFKRLMSLVQSGKMFPLQEMGETHRVVARDFKWTPEKLNTQGTGWQGVFLLIVEEVK